MTRKPNFISHQFWKRHLGETITLGAALPVPPINATRVPSVAPRAPAESEGNKGSAVT